MKGLVFFLLPLGAFAASGGGGEYDIVPRAINFVIFVAILYYFLATPFRNFYKNRILKISSRLDEIQKKLLESKAKKLEIMKKLEEARAVAAGALITAKKESEILAEQIRSNAKEELVLLQRHFEEQKEYEWRKMKREVVSHIITELFNNKDVRLTQEDIIDIMMKKAS